MRNVAITEYSGFGTTGERPSAARDEPKSSSLDETPRKPGAKKWSRGNRRSKRGEYASALTGGLTHH